MIKTFAPLLVLLLFLPAAGGAALPEVAIESATGTHRFAVEIADEPEERATGLMHRDRLDAGGGMLFVFPEAYPVRMWMKDTRIPLDMVFVDETGRVAQVFHEAEPYSTAEIAAGGPVKYVLEINGGAARRLGIREGDTVRLPQ